MRERREISPALNATAEEYLRVLPVPIQGIVKTIRAEKDEGTRPRPSSKVIDRSSLLTSAKRVALLDMVASLVDENLTGRSDMCFQFALLIDRALEHLKIPSRAVIGKAVYFSEDGEEVFRWEHAWVRVGTEVIDGNVDILAENPMVPDQVIVAPYWGPIKGVPGRRLVEREPLADDPDVVNEWWPYLRSWLDTDFQTIL